MNIFKKNPLNKNNIKDYSFSTSKQDRKDLCTAIINSSSPQPGFYFLLAIATFIVSIGLITNNVVLVIGGMLVAPLISPILSISLAITILNFKVLLRSILVFTVSMLASLLAAICIGLAVEFDINQIQFLTTMNNLSIFTLLIPVSAGAAASFTWAKKNLSGALPGVAVTVTLLPPLTAMGLSLAVNEHIIFYESLTTYLFNVLGIILGSLIIFLLMGFYKSEKIVIEQVAIEEES